MKRTSLLLALAATALLASLPTLPADAHGHNDRDGYLPGPRFGVPMPPLPRFLPPLPVPRFLPPPPHVVIGEALGRWEGREYGRGPWYGRHHRRVWTEGYWDRWGRWVPGYWR